MIEGDQLSNHSSFSIEKIITSLRKCELLPESTVRMLTQKGREILFEEANLQMLVSPVTVYNYLLTLRL